MPASTLGKRRLLARALQGILLLMALASVAVWFSSLRYRACLVGDNWVLFSQTGQISFAYWGFEDDDTQKQFESFWHPTGLGAYRENATWDRSWLFSGLRIRHRSVRIPTLCLAIPPAVAACLMAWRSRRFPAGHCQKCHYNLTLNVSGVCPECGTPVAERPGGARREG